MINKEDAEAIADKLKARLEEKTNHTVAQFWHNGRLVIWFGIRRGSKKDLPHEYIPSQMKLTQKQCVLFRSCKISLESYVDILIEKGFIET